MNMNNDGSAISAFELTNQIDLLFLEYLKDAIGDLVAPIKQSQVPDTTKVNPNNLLKRDNFQQQDLQLKLPELRDLRSELSPLQNTGKDFKT